MRGLSVRQPKMASKPDGLTLMSSMDDRTTPDGMCMKRAVQICATSFVFLFAHTAPARGDHPPATSQSLGPCADPAHRQFDFWIGDWDVVEVEHPTVIVARARVELILNGCVLHEVYEGTDGHRGESFSIYDVTRSIWHQSWVNDTGYLLTIEGRLQDKSMILEGVDHLPNGKLRRVRGEWRADDQGAHELAWRSTDGGASWVPWFDLLFRPHASPAKPSAQQ
jgi:hypothetical protein